MLVTFGAANARDSAEKEAVPFELSGGRIYVQAFVNGRGPYRFGFDTGASGVGRADTRLATELALPMVTQAQNSDGVAVTTTDVVSVESIRLGPVIQRKAELLSRDYNRNLKAGNQPMMGIIAREFFADKIIVIDYPARTIRFRDGALDPKAAGVIHYAPGFTIPVCFGELCHPGKIDTGSNRGLVLPKDIAEKVSVGAPVLLGQAARTNSSVSLYEVPVRGPVRVGALTASPSKVLYADPSTDTVNIGSDFLKDYVLTIDSKNELLRIDKPAIPVRPHSRPAR
jgi:hypothetical protein